MNTQNGELDALVQAELQKDVEFQTSLAALSSDDEKKAAVEKKKGEVLVRLAPTFYEDSKKHKTSYESTKTRAENAEEELKTLKGGKDSKEEKKDQVLSVADMYALQKGGVEIEDVEEVQRLSTVFGKSIVETLNEDSVKTILKDRSEKRATARAADTGNGGTQPTLSKESILERSRKGERFAPGSREAELLYKAKNNLD